MAKSTVDPKNETTQAPAATGISVIPSSQFLGLTQDQGDMQTAMASLAESGEQIGPGDMTRVPLPTGGGTYWEVPSATGDPEQTKELLGVLVYYQKAGILWPQEEMEKGSIPVLRTLDLEIAEQIGNIPPEMAANLETCRIDERHFNWSEKPIVKNGRTIAGNPYNQWGTGKGGNGKRCKEQRMLFLLRPNDIFPIYVIAQPGSLKPVTQFIKGLFMQHRIQYWGAIVSLTLQKVQNEQKKDYTQIVPRLAGKLSAEDTLRVHKTWTLPLATMIRQAPQVADAVDVPAEEPVAVAVAGDYNREPGEEG